MQAPSLLGDGRAIKGGMSAQEGSQGGEGGLGLWDRAQLDNAAGY